MTSLRDSLQRHGIDRLDFELLLAFCLKKDRSFVLAHPEYPLTLSQVRRFKGLVKRREGHEPLAYILGEKEFFGLPFSVNRHTLIPRPETELLVEAVLKQVSRFKFQDSKKKVAIVDIGTGSGCIIISLTKHLLDSSSRIHASCSKLHGSCFKIFATDISPEALRVARKNATRHGVAKEIHFVESDLLAGVAKKLQLFDTIIFLANLPYLSSAIYKNTVPGVRRYEPKSALVSGRDGLDHYRRLFRQMARFLPGKTIAFFLEISPEQAKKLNFLPGTFRFVRDLSGRPRLVAGSVLSTKQKPRA